MIIILHRKKNIQIIVTTKNKTICLKLTCDNLKNNFITVSNRVECLLHNYDTLNTRRNIVELG